MEQQSSVNLNYTFFFKSKIKALKYTAEILRETSLNFLTSLDLLQLECSNDQFLLKTLCWELKYSLITVNFPLIQSYLFTQNLKCRFTKVPRFGKMFNIYILIRGVKGGLFERVQTNHFVDESFMIISKDLNFLKFTKNGLKVSLTAFYVYEFGIYFARFDKNLKICRSYG